MMENSSDQSLHTVGSDRFLLEVRNLKVHFFTEVGVIQALDGVDLWVKKGETLGLVGESGCGKTLTARAIMRLIPSPGGIIEGEIFLDGENLINLPENKMRRVRGDRISMVFQEPMTSLNPVYTVGNQIVEVLTVHRSTMTAKEKKARAIELLKEVGIPSPDQRFYDYPRQLSGGMRQRVVIAMALACGNPQLLIADEPTTALDVTIQAQILELFKKIQEKMGMSILLITHDLGVIAETADRVAVMYAGSIVEYADVVTLFKHPLHPYTMGLLKSILQVPGKGGNARLYTIPGGVPNLTDVRRRCRFFPRCAYGREDICCREEPKIYEVLPGHLVRCARIDVIDKHKSEA